MPFSVFSAATSTGFGIGTKSSFPVYCFCWPCVSAQKMNLRSSAAFELLTGRIT